MLSSYINVWVGVHGVYWSSSQFYDLDSEEENEFLAAVDLENVNVTDKVACVASVSVANFDALATRKFGREQKKKEGGGREERRKRLQTNPRGPVSQKSRNFSGLFRVPQFPSYLRNAEVLSLQTSQSSWFFLHQKHVKRSAFQNKRIAAWQLAFRARKALGTFEKQAPGIWKPPTCSVTAARTHRNLKLSSVVINWHKSQAPFAGERVFQIPGVCLQAFPSLLSPSPSPSFLFLLSSQLSRG